MATASRLFASSMREKASTAAAPTRPRRRFVGNQARLRQGAKRNACAECDEAEKTRGARAQSAPPAKADDVNASGPPAKPTKLDVWGLPITQSMCGCKQRVKDDIDWANVAAKTYAGCNTPANSTSDLIEACFKAAHPTAVVIASTDTSGAMALPPPSADPCQRIADKSTFVHETMHSRHAADMAKAQGAAFYAEWQKLIGDKDQLDKLRLKFPTEVDKYLKQWNSGDDWAKDEVNSYTWERRFLQDALNALNQIC